jgi:hypothetical protein
MFICAISFTSINTHTRSYIGTPPSRVTSPRGLCPNQPGGLWDFSGWRFPPAYARHSFGVWVTPGASPGLHSSLFWRLSHRCTCAQESVVSLCWRRLCPPDLGICHVQLARPVADALVSYRPARDHAHHVAVWRTWCWISTRFDALQNNDKLIGPLGVRLYNRVAEYRIGNIVKRFLRRAWSSREEATDFVNETLSRAD